MKKAFTSNWYIYKVCLPSVIIDTQNGINEKASAIEKYLSLNRDFKELLVAAIDEALSSLGYSAKQAIYYHLEKDFNINKQEIPSKIREFINAIEEIFGIGAKFLEIEIMKRLYEKTGCSFKYVPDQDELVFSEYVEAVRSSTYS